MATSQASLVVPPADIAVHWGIELTEPLERIPAATNVVLRAGSYIVRSEQRPVGSVRWEHELLGFLAEEVSEVVAPIRAPDGTTLLARGEHVVSVFPFIAGNHIERMDDRVRAALPEVLGRMHRRAQSWPVTRQRPAQPSFRELDWESNLWWEWRLVEATPVLEDAFGHTREWVDNAPALAVCAIHGDFNPGNVLSADGRVAAVLDWSFARLDWAAFDLASVVGMLTVQEDGSIDADVAERVIATYLDAGGPGEPDVLVPLLRLFFLAVSLFSLTRRARSESSNPEIVAMMERALGQLG